MTDTRQQASFLRSSFACSFHADDTREQSDDGDSPEEGAEDTPGFLVYYKKRQDEPMFPGCPMTVLEYCFAVFQDKVSNHCFE